ncbi:MAG: hypothetical protein RL711_1094 [Bacteroidota bacterium]
MDAYTIYGIKNCDTVKKALLWLKTNAIAYEFHDYKSKGITEHKIQTWVNQVGWEELINKKVPPGENSMMPIKLASTMMQQRFL